MFYHIILYVHSVQASYRTFHEAVLAGDVAKVRPPPAAPTWKVVVVLVLVLVLVLVFIVC